MTTHVLTHGVLSECAPRDSRREGKGREGSGNASKTNCLPHWFAGAFAIGFGSKR